MSEHIWSQEQIASYFTGGLSLEERERLDRHAKECAECAAAFTAAIHFDRGLGTLFAPLRPKPGLEDRAVQATRIAPKRHAILILGWPRRITAAAAAIILLGTFGALGVSLLKDGNLPMPGETLRMSARGALPASPEALKRIQVASGIPNEDPGQDVSLDALSSDVRMRVLRESDVKANENMPKPDGLPEETTALRGHSLARSQYENNRPGNGNTWSVNGYAPNFGLGNLGGGGGFAGNGAMPQPQKDGTQLFAYYSGNSVNPSNTTQPGQPNVVAVNPTSGPAPTPGTSVTAVNNGKPANDLYFKPDGYRFLTNGGKANEEPTKNLDDVQKSDGKPAKKDGPAAPVIPNPTNTANNSINPAAAPEPPAPEPSRRVVLRSGDIEFELESFDSGLATVTQLVTKIKGAFVGTVNSEKLANGKVRGSITVRTPPEFLDALVLDLRKELGKGGELKSVRLVSQDVTKQYTDTESRLKAARAMETRLLKMIQDGKGEIKQLLEAERELGVWRTKIEESEGELRYFASHAALSTLTITLMEKEIRTAAGVTENERVQAGVEVEDVDKTYQQVLKEVVDAKGRVLKSELKQLAAGQFNATLNFEVAPEASGPIRDRLRQVGRVARLEIDRQQQADGGTMPKNAPLKRGDSLFIVQLYNLANIAPRETATLAVAVADVPNAYNAIRDAIAKASGRVQVAQLNENDKTNVTAQLDFDVKRTDEGAIRAALAAAGDVASRTVSRAAESDQTTDTKILYRVSLSSVARLRPRDALSLTIAATDVSATYATLRNTVTAAKGRILASNLDENDQQNVNAALDFEVARTQEAAVKGSLDAAGEVVSRNIAHAPENEAATDTKVLYSIRLLPANRLKPRETTVLGLEVADVDNTVAVFTAQFNEAKGRAIDSKIGRERGKATARLVYEVPLATASGLVEKFKSAGTVRALTSAKDPTAPEGKSATARIEITLANAESVVGPDDGVWPPVKKGLSYSFSVLLTSLTWVVFALCVVLPWALLLYGGYRLLRRMTRTTPVNEPPVVPPSAA